jgi:hypothetical protein
VPFSKGCLTRIARHGEAVDYRYDRFGRILQDGPWPTGYDANGNPTSLMYPGGVLSGLERKQALACFHPPKPASAGEELI